MQPLCRKFSLIAPANSHKYRVRFKCDQKCISERTINACWTGRAGYSAGEYCSGGHRMPINGALQGVPAVTALANWTMNNYIPSDVSTNFYICSEADENVDKNILEMYIDDN